jgi:hypothetical protein
MDYKEERSICEYLGLQVNKGDWVLAYYGSVFKGKGEAPTGWQVVCHLSKLKSYLSDKIHPEHNKNK